MGQKFLLLIVGLPVIIVALSLHEFGHAAMATRMGDPTPRLQGRLTLNPLAHLDPMGTLFIIVTLMMGFGFGWGKPVQTNPAYYSDYRMGRILVAIAGPAMNLCQAMLAIAAGFLLYSANVNIGVIGHMILFYFIVINVVLMLFNLIPIPPLDGGHVLEMVAPPAMREGIRRMAPFGILIVLGLLWFTPIFGMMIGGFFSLMNWLIVAGFGAGYAEYLWL